MRRFYVKKMQKYHIFDLDGTLVDSIPVWSGTMLRILQEEKINYPDDIIKTIMPLGYRGTAEYFLKLGVKAPSVESLVERMYSYAYDGYLNTIPLKKGVKSYLQRLKSEGKQLFVLTASPHLVKNACLKRNGVFELFSELWSTDDFSFHKADARIYEEVCKKLQCEPKDVCFYDDSLTNLKTAKEIGIYTVGVYDVSSDESQEEIKETADDYCRSFEEL